MLRRAVAAAITAAALAAAGASGAPEVGRASCPVCGHNVIANPGAEAGQGAAGDEVVKVPGWAATGGFTAARYAWSGGDLSASTPGSPGRGSNYFYGGPAAATSSGTQTVSLPGAAGATATLSGWIGGYTSQGDDATVTVTFLAAGAQPLATVHIGPVTAAARSSVSKLVFRTASATVPTGTVSATIRIVMRRFSGSDNDGLADNLSLVLAAGGGGGSGGGGGTTTTSTTTPTAQIATATATGTVTVNGRPFTSGTLRYGAKVDVTNGNLLLTTDTGKIHLFGKGVFAHFQLLRGVSDRKPIVELKLIDGDFSVCKRTTSSGVASAAATTVRQLWGDGKGRFRTKGRYSSATVRGTIWLTADRCDGTFTRVDRGVIQVSDFPQRRTVTVRRGSTYLARP